MRFGPRLVALCWGLATVTLAGQATPPATPAAGRAPSTPGATAGTTFAAGLAALHSFEYEDAQAAFIQARRADPRFAMAYWGEAMTYHQTLWGHEDVAAGRRVLEAAARAGVAATDVERPWLAAVAELFGDGDGEARRQRYAEAMRRLHEARPDDPEAATFHALALLGTTSRSLIGYVDAHEGHGSGLAGSAVQAQVGAILSGVLARHPDHPGALHYLIHAYDDPAHARLGLEAARRYAAVAPESSHARHMPAHVFLQLGLWADAEASDRAAFAASEAWVARKGLGPAMRSYHALAWRQYELLQLGRVAEARALLDVLTPVVDGTRDLTLLSDLASMRARQVLEAQDWARMANVRTFANVNEVAAIGISAARAANAPLAELARQHLASRIDAVEEGDLRPAIAIMERQVAGLVALAAGRRDEAVAILAVAADAEAKLPPPLGLPIPPIPAPELLGEVLIEVGRPAEALAAFEQALARNPNRTRSVLGTARALAALGRGGEAATHYRQVLANYEHADPDRPELREARGAIASPSRVPETLRETAARWPLAGWTALAAVALATAAWWYRSRRAAAPVSRAERRREQRRHK